MQTQTSKHLGVDGYPRSKEQDEKISQDLASTFNSPSGLATLQYLKSITIEAITGANISAEELRHLEGQRYLVALIAKRVQHAESINHGRNITTNTK
jgi:hypothetical protein